ncbi:MAG TPA: hypothetical protein VK179_17100 [Bacteroidales bacterium]|nr:hypothetical protein [Bacteroidales bacterium]
MSLAEYSLIFITILVGFIVTVAMTGWGKLIKYFDRKKFSVLYLSWSVSLFFYLLFIWLWAFKGFKNNLDYLNSTSSLFYIIIRLLILYFAIEILTPDGNNDFKNHFITISRKFYVLLIILWSYELLLYPLTGHFELSPRILLYFINLPVAILLFFLKHNRIQIALSIIVLIVLIFANLFVVSII